MSAYIGMQFKNMSNEYLVQVFDKLSEKTSDHHPYPDDWMDEWNACKAELLARLNSAVGEP